VVRKKNWGEDRVSFFGDDGQLTSIPAQFTDVDPPDPFVVVSAGRSAFTVRDLLALGALLEGILPRKRARSVRPTSPSV
jgi:Family of unknown function (DUF5372)